MNLEGFGVWSKGRITGQLQSVWLSYTSGTVPLKQPTLKDREDIMIQNHILNVLILRCPRKSSTRGAVHVSLQLQGEVWSWALTVSCVSVVGSFLWSPTLPYTEGRGPLFFLITHYASNDLLSIYLPQRRKECVCLLCSHILKKKHTVDNKYLLDDWITDSEVLSRVEVIVHNKAKSISDGTIQEEKKATFTERIEEKPGWTDGWWIAS